MAGKGVTIEGLNETIKGFKDFNEKVSKNQGIGDRLAGNQYKNDVQAKVTEIGLYNTGDYHRSIHVEPTSGTFEDSGGKYVVVGTDNVAARQHEFGGVIKAKNAPYLVFQTEDGVWHKVKAVTQPPHPHFQPALDENREKYLKIMKEALLR